MLVLSRKTNERIEVGDNITIIVNKIAGNRVSLAIEAPRDVRVVRGELHRIVSEFDEPRQQSVAIPMVGSADNQSVSQRNVG